MPGRLIKEGQRQYRSVALAYSPETDKAPKVIASGRGEIAQRIVDIAAEHGIHIHEDPDLVEALSQLDLDDEIPVDLYIVISEILAFVYSLNQEKLTLEE